MDNRRLAERIGKNVSGKKATLEGYKLFFCFDNTHIEPYADIRQSDNDLVYGVLYQLNEEDIKKIDEYEETLVDGEKSYSKRTVNVRCNENTYPAVVYTMTTKMNFSKPRSEYMNYLLNGLKLHGYDDDIVRQVTLSSERGA